MEAKDLFSLLKKLEIPVAYDHFDEKVKPPYLRYDLADTHNFLADGHVYDTIYRIDIELVTATKDMALERKLEALLNSFKWSKSTQYSSDEKVYITVYEFEERIE